MNKISNRLSAECAKYARYINKRTTQGGALAMSLILLFAGAYVSAPARDTVDEAITATRTAGIFAAVTDIEVSAGESADVYMASSDVTLVAAKTDEVETDSEYDQWSDVVMANVNDYLYIRSEADENSEAIAKLRAGDVATLIDVFDGWYEVESGNAHGYVSAEYCVTGIEAYELAQDVCSTYATTDVSGLRIRSEASEDSSILKVVSKGTKLIVNSDVEAAEGWIAVTSAGTSGFVKADYVQVDMETGEAITLAEEAEAQAQAAAAAQAAKEAAAAAAAANQAIISSADDLSLLAAIIQIEAGNECMEGQVAVGSVVLNRVRSGAYPGSIGGVIFAKGQFSTSRMSSILAKGPKASCVQAAQAALAGVDTTGGATHFRRAGSKQGLIIGNHVFY